MKIKEILLYIGIIILILVGGYLKKDEINIIEGNIGTTNTKQNIIKSTLQDCQDKCDNDCKCKMYIWKKGNPEDEKHDCIMINDEEQLITNKYDHEKYDIYDYSARKNLKLKQYYTTIRGGFDKKAAEMACKGAGLVLSTKQEVKEAGNGNRNLSYGWTSDGNKPLKWYSRGNRIVEINRSRSYAHCSENPNTNCNNRFHWRDIINRWRWTIRRSRIYPRWWYWWWWSRYPDYNNRSIIWNGQENNSNVVKKSKQPNKFMCKYRCIEDWNNECKMIQYNIRSKECKTTNKKFGVRSGGGNYYNQVSEKIEKSPLRPR